MGTGRWIGIMVYLFARVRLIITMKVGAYFEHRQRKWLRLHEKGGKWPTRGSPIRGLQYL
jgi:hypothetical protein